MLLGIVIIVVVAATVAVVFCMLRKRQEPAKTLCPHKLDWDHCPDCCH